MDIHAQCSGSISGIQDEIAERQTGGGCSMFSID